MLYYIIIVYTYIYLYVIMLCAVTQPANRELLYIIINTRQCSLMSLMSYTNVWHIGKTYMCLAILILSDNL